MSSADRYIHGYNAAEQNRLYDQARFLEDRVFDGVDFSSHHHVLEVGCGVGAQTELLLRRFPSLRVTGIDLSPAQIARAQHHFESLPELRDRCRFIVGDAASLRPSPTDPFDGAYLCWILEHVPRPLELLTNLKHLLSSGSKICVAEVLNSNLHIHPHLPALTRYWEAYNALQQSLGGDPWIGAKLGDLLSRAGFSGVQVRPQPILHDCRDPEARDQMLAYWHELLLSASDNLLGRCMVQKSLIEQLEQELRRLRQDPEAIFFYAFMKAEARS